ncbi:MAG: MFS transporter [Candidatus Eisenbacteria bacterium]|nr:MFS transporter [Candidatus Eisenbacteria bacterium]
MFDNTNLSPWLLAIRSLSVYYNGNSPSNLMKIRLFETVADSFSMRPADTFSALKHRNFRLFWSGQLLSLVGTWMQSVAQAWLVFRLTKSPLLLGTVGFAASFPVLLLSLPAGVIADRYEKRKILVATQASFMIVALTIAALVFSNRVQVWHVIILALITGIVNAFDAPTRQSFVAEIAGKDDLLNAIALNSTSFNAARVVGPAIAGLLVAVAGEGGCFLINGLSYIPIITTLRLVKTPFRGANSGDMNLMNDLLEGLRYLRKNREFTGIVSIVAAASLLGMPYLMLMPVFAKDVLHKGASGFGFLMSSTGLGAFLGALGLASLRAGKRRGAIFVVGALAFPVLIFIFSFSENYLLSALLLFGIGWAMVSQTVVGNTLIQGTVNHELRGRVMSVYTLVFMGMMPIGSLQAGWLAEHLGAPSALAIGGAILFLFSMGVLRSRSGIGRMR